MRFLNAAPRAATLAAVCAALAAATAPLLAAELRAGDLVIEQPWARATPGGAKVAGGYLTVRNRGAAADRLVGGSFEAAERFELHSMTSDNGIMRMRPSGPLTIPPGGTLTLAPSGTHIMFTGLKHGLKPGESVKGTLAFEHAGTVPVTFDVGGIAATVAPGQPAKPGAAPGQPAKPGAAPGQPAKPGAEMPGMKMD